MLWSIRSLAFPGSCPTVAPGELLGVGVEAVDHLAPVGEVEAGRLGRTGAGRRYQPLDRDDQATAALRAAKGHPTGKLVGDFTYRGTLRPWLLLLFGLPPGRGIATLEGDSCQHGTQARQEQPGVREALVGGVGLIVVMSWSLVRRLNQHLEASHRRSHPMRIRAAEVFDPHTTDMIGVDAHWTAK